MKRRVFLKSMAGMGFYMATRQGLSMAATQGATSASESLTGQAGKSGQGYSWMAGALDGFSATLVQEHLALYERYRAELKRLEDQDKSLDLGGSNPVTSRWRTHLLSHLELHNAVRLHDYYFSGLTSRKLSAGKLFSRMVDKHFGSFDQWWIKFRASAVASRAWTMFGFDRQSREPLIYSTDNDSQCPLDFIPVLVVDMAEHAYCLDYPGDPYTYLDVWLKRVNWQKIDERLEGLEENG